MKKLLTTAFLVLTMAPIFASDTLSAINNQKHSQLNYLTGGFGYFANIGGMGLFENMSDIMHGNTSWVEVGKTMDNNFRIGLRAAYATTTDVLDNKWPLFEGNLRPSVYMHFTLALSRPFSIGQNQKISIGSGIVLIRNHLISPHVWVTNNIVYASLSSEQFWDMALDATLDYKYEFKSGFYLGLRASNYIVWGMGPEGFTITPTIGVSF